MSEPLLRELLMLLVAAVVGYLCAYFGAYAKKRGEAYATKADFDDLLAQLKATTAVAEEVKAQVSHADWATRELKTLRRIKLEELLQAIHETHAWEDQACGFMIYASGTEPGPPPLPTVQRLAALYFPELQQSVNAYCLSHRTSMHEIYSAKVDVMAASDNEAKYAVLEAFGPKRVLRHTAGAGAIAAIEVEGRTIMATLIGA